MFTDTIQVYNRGNCVLRLVVLTPLAFLKNRGTWDLGIRLNRRRCCFGLIPNVFNALQCGSCVGKRFGMMNPKMCKAANVQEIRTVMVKIHNTIRDHVPLYSSGCGFSCRGVAGPWPFVELWSARSSLSRPHRPTPTIFRENPSTPIAMYSHPSKVQTL